MASSTSTHLLRNDVPDALRRIDGLNVGNIRTSEGIVRSVEVQFEPFIIEIEPKPMMGRDHHEDLDHVLFWSGFKKDHVTTWQFINEFNLRGGAGCVALSEQGVAVQHRIAVAGLPRREAELCLITNLSDFRRHLFDFNKARNDALSSTSVQ